MVVQFPPAGSADGGPAAEGRGLAPVTYLPGAQPSDAAQNALARVRSLSRRAAADADENATTAQLDRRDRKATRAGNVAIHQLARRGMSRWELEQVLAKREVDGETAAAELDRLESLGLLDDAALAVSVVYSMHTRKGSGRAAIEGELRRRHLDDAVIADAMAELDGDDELERATELAMARARQLRSVDYDVAARRLSAYLARKGYDGEVIRASVRTALEGHPRGSTASGGVRFR
ncbi:hypothetical protein GCM10027415_05070 [Humibacter ginsengisoli]